MSNQTGRMILLTGATGFLGKVVLWELLRRQGRGAGRSIGVVVRDRPNEAAAERFRRKVIGSDCWPGLARDAVNRVQVIPGDLEKERFGLGPDAWQDLARSTGTVIHCAASIDFHLPIAQAERANVGTALEVLALARLARADRLVSVSTAYSTPHPGNGVPVDETPAPLLCDPDTLRRDIREGRYDRPEDEAALLERSGHPNTYTLTKCLTEHLLTSDAGNVALTIVRPSIISASWRRPMPGWIDSPAAFALLAMMIATGRLRVVMGRPDTRIDVVPVDIVADRIIEAALATASNGTGPVGTPVHPRVASKATILHAVAGIERSPRIDQCARRVERFFAAHPPGVGAAAAPRIRFIGTDGPLYRLWHLGAHRLPRHTRPVAAQVAETSRRFSYFTTRSFEFRSSRPLDEPDFEPARYLDLICRGIGRHLLSRAPETLPKWSG